MNLISLQLVVFLKVAILKLNYSNNPILYYQVNRLKQIKTMVAILWSCRLQNENWTQITREKRKDKFGHKGATYRIVLATFACMLQNKSKIQRWYPNTHTLFFFEMVMIIIPCATYILLNEPRSLDCVRHLEICTDDIAKMLELRYHQFHLFLCKLSMQIGDRFHL